MAVKWYLPEDLDAEAIQLLEKSGTGAVELIAPATVQPEFFNALWQQRRREGLPLDELLASWEAFHAESLTLYAPEDLMTRAVEIAVKTGTIVYDALFLALATETGTVMVTADNRLLNSLRDTSYSSLALSLDRVASVL